MTKRSILLPVIFAALLFAACKPHTEAPGTPSEVAKVRIPINVPLTGPIAAWSGGFPNGFKMGIDEASKKYGVDPTVFVVDAQDNAGKPPQAVSIFRKQELAGFDAYISVTTGTANAIGPLLDQSGKPHFIAAFDPFITKPAPSRFRMMANSKIEAPLFIEYAKAKGAKSVFIVQLDFSYAEDEFSRIVEPALAAAGIRTTKERFTIDQREFRTIVAKIKAVNPDLIFLCGYSFHLQPLVRDVRDAGLLSPGRVMTSMDFVDLLYADTPRAELKDVMFACPYFDIPGKIAEATSWRERYRKRFGSNPTYVPAYAYDTATLLVRAYSQKHNIGVEAIKAATPFEGVNGTIQLDGDRDILSTLTIATLDAQGNIVEKR